jgi:hypothetical protein
MNMQYDSYNNNGGGDYGVYSTFSNISVISSQSVLLVKETRVPGENN